MFVVRWLLVAFHSLSSFVPMESLGTLHKVNGTAVAMGYSGIRECGILYWQSVIYLDVFN
jgi:hypothetical protein